MGLRINSIESLFRGISVPAGQKLEVMVGEVVRVHMEVDYRGPAINGVIHVSYGKQVGFVFNEDGNKQSDINVSFDQSMDWEAYEITCDVPIGGSTGPGYDLYAKIIGVPGPDIFSPTLLNVLDVLGVAEFRDFSIVSYEKV